MKIVKIDENILQSMIQKIRFFKYLEDKEREKFLSICDIVEFSLPEKIIEQGKIHPFFYCILEGKVDVNMRSQGIENYITTIEAGEIFGETGIFMDLPRTADVVAKNTVKLLQIPRRNFMSFIKQNPVAGNKILMYIIYGLMHKLQETNQDTAFERQVVLSQNEIDDFLEFYLK